MLVLYFFIIFIMTLTLDIAQIALHVLIFPIYFIGFGAVYLFTTGLLLILDATSTLHYEMNPHPGLYLFGIQSIITTTALIVINIIGLKNDWINIAQIIFEDIFK